MESRAAEAQRSAHFVTLHLNMQEATTWKKRIDRPLGVYLIAIYDFLFVGLVPLLTFVLFLRRSDTELPFIETLISVGLYFVVMGASVWACAGDNIGRWLLLTAVSLTGVLWIVNAVMILSNMELTSGEKPSVIGFISRGTLSLVLNWWYFNRKTTLAYYKRSAAIS